MSKMIQGYGKIISNDEIKPRYFLMEITSPSIAKEAKPGQFVTIRCCKTAVPLLRRPFSFFKINGSRFQILYEVIGDGTRILSNLKSGDEIDILGPLGNGFMIPDKRRDFVLIGGGIGIVPLTALAQKLVTLRHKRIYAIIGARNKKKLLCDGDFKGLGIEPIIATDDGSYGKKALATDLLDELFSKVGAVFPTIFACGPEPMLKRITHIARKRGLDCHASLETNIACGVGACLGCAVRTKFGYKLVCKDGPVFNLNEIIW
ncbi:MAG: dihydroorotate dehydrogenase electron transfer subunit [Candidatus Omnitrophota bacterium]